MPTNNTKKAICVNCVFCAKQTSSWGSWYECASVKNVKQDSVTGELSRQECCCVNPSGNCKHYQEERRNNSYRRVDDMLAYGTAQFYKNQKPKKFSLFS